MHLKQKEGFCGVFFGLKPSFERIRKSMRESLNDEGAFSSDSKGDVAIRASHEHRRDVFVPRSPLLDGVPLLHRS